MKYYDRAIDINPQHAEAHWNRSLILLLTGQFKQGWQEYEWRRETENRQRRNLPGTAWQGQPLKDCRILLYSEQGIGDTIQFIRYAAELKKLGAKVIVEIPGALLRIFNTCAGIDKIIPQGEKLPPFEFHASLMSLPRLLDTRNENIPVNIPYLGPAPENKTSIEKAFRSKNSGLRVGIAWGGNPEHPNDHNRSCPARYFSALGRIEGLQTFSLQKGPHQSELATITGTMPITDLSACLHDFADTANALAYLDLVITVDTSIAHLAGAMGSPVWLLLPFVPDWRWQLDREDSPWYPTMRLFRQHKRGEWEGVFNRVITALDELNNQD